MIFDGAAKHSLSEATGRSRALRYHAFAMNKQHYYFKLIPPRPTFAQDMTDEEKTLMEEHGAYFQQQLTRASFFSMVR